MINLANIRSLSDFQRNTRRHLHRLRKTGEPELLTVNGQAELIVQSAAAYQKLLDQADLALSTRILEARIAAADAGVKGIPAKDVVAAVRKRLRLSKSK